MRKKAIAAKVYESAEAKAFEYIENEYRAMILYLSGGISRLQNIAVNQAEKTGLELFDSHYQN